MIFWIAILSIGVLTDALRCKPMYHQELVQLVTDLVDEASEK